MRSLITLSFITVILFSPKFVRADLLDRLGLGKKTTNQTPGISSALSQDQMVLGLKEALGKGVQRAVAELGRTNGFLTNLNVRIPMPEKLQQTEKTLRALKQDQLADNFVATMNHAAEQAVPEASSVFADAVQQMSIDDARSLLTGPNDAGTEYFRRTAATNLFARFLPIVKKATDQTGATANYKKLMGKVGSGTSTNKYLGGLTKGLNAAGYLNADTMDIDAYVTQKAMDGLFKMVADEEKKIRENPAARSTELLQKVFGSITKK
ncbi:MAG: DUF4197 domain-containing protein [Verrucomicrobiota bacterium]